MTGYHGITGDAQLYAFQALSRIHPQLATDLYLQNISQDQFTIFSPIYAWIIGALGLENAARLLTFMFTVWFSAAAWDFARTLGNRDIAWLGVGFLLLTSPDYGGSGVFHVSEPFLTARLPAQTLVVTALACQARGLWLPALALTVVALLFHPLMALPGLLLLLCMWLSYRVSAAAVIIGVLAAFGIAVTATMLPPVSSASTVMDAAWLKVVVERSQFLFLHLWSFRDWSVNTRPFIYLGFTAIAIADGRVRKYCMAAALIGAAGLAVALIGSLIGPIAVLVQGQGWRWVWIAGYLGALLLPLTVLQVWQDDKCGPLCALLLVAGWTWPAVDGNACASLALSLWVARTHISARARPYLRWAAAAIAIAMISWVAVKSWAIMEPSNVPSASASSGSTQVTDVFVLPALVFSALVWWRMRSRHTNFDSAILSAMLLIAWLFLSPVAFKHPRIFAPASDINEFSEWKNAIPATSTVLVAPAQDAGAFVWFTLERPNYLALNQSAGAVFSRATSLEIARRSQVLLPLMDPDWKILSRLRAASAAGNHKTDGARRPLTAERLTQVCADAQLGFVISPVSVGFDPSRHEHAGAWKDWLLYDCRKLRLPESAK